MDELGYVYNRGAAALREKERRLVGLVITNFENSFLTQSANAIEHRLAERGYTTLVLSSQNHRENQENALRNLQEFDAAGVIITAVEDTTPRVVDALHKAGMACLSYTRDVAGAEADYVGPDDVAGGGLAAKHLVDHGVERLAFVESDSPASASVLRRQGIEAHHAEAGLAAPLIAVQAPMTVAGGYTAGRKLLEDPEGLPDGIICVSDSVAFGLYRALFDADAQNLTRVIGFDDVELSSYSYPRLTTISSHPMDLGRIAADTLVERLTNPQEQVRARYLTPDLVVRESCGCGTGRPI